MPRRILNKTFCICLVIDFFYYLVGYLTDTYWTTWVWVVQYYSERDWTYMTEIETVTLCLFGLIGGTLQRYTHRYKAIQIFGLGLRCIGSGINYWSSTGHINTATLFFAKFILCAGGGLEVVATQTAAQGSVKHKDVAMAIAILGLWTQVGGAIGQAVAGSIWSNRLPRQLALHAPSLNATEIATIAGDQVAARLAEPREGVIKAFNETYERLSLISLILVLVPFIAALFTTNYYLDDRQNAVECVKVEPGAEQAIPKPERDDRESR